MGQIKGNPAADRSTQNQAYTNQYGVGGAAYRDMGSKPVMIDDQTTLDAVVDSGSLGYTKGYAKDTDLIDGTLNANFNTLTANQYYVTIYSSSILYSSGSTLLGDSLDDAHSLTGSVSITGSLNVNGLTKLDYIVFDSSSTSPFQSYMLQANTTDKTLDLRMGGDATLQLGQELYYPPIVNKSGGNLPNGCLVMFNPADPTQGNRIAVVKCISDGTYPADYIVGILTEDIAVNQEGFATWFGYVRNVSRTELESAGLKDPAETWTEGQILYPHPTRAGGLTNVQPTAPNLKSSICTITSINGVNITFLVRPHLRGTIKGLHDTIDTSTNSTYGDLLMKSGSVWTNSKTLIGDYKISGSLFISGATELGGNLVPKTARGATLGTLERPFRDIFIQSASINIQSDTAGAPNTTISNVDGNLLISAGGMRLVGSASFIAETGSFGYISGSMTQVGDYNQTGNYKIIGHKQITGSLDVKGNINVASGSGFYYEGNKLFNRGQFYNTTTQSGSANTAYPIQFNSTDTTVTNNGAIYIADGSKIYVKNTGIYNFQIAAQLHTTVNEAVDFSIWFSMTGSNVANSNTEITIEKISGGGYMLATLNYLMAIPSGSYSEIYYSKTTAAAQILAKGTQSTPARPATPSVILTVTQVG
jgi:hypothetical protein